MSFPPLSAFSSIKHDADLNSMSLNFKGGITFISPKHFKKQEDIEVMKKLLRRSLLRVHVETSAFCNRRCGFCPNSEGSRIENKQQISDSIYLKILEDLKTIEYDKLFGFHQYNEPLADRIILTRIAQAREYLPEANLAIHSNGDYLDREYLEAIEASGLNTLNISIYGPNNGEFIDSFIMRKMAALANKLGLEFDVIYEYSGSRYLWATDFRNMKLQLMANNYWVNGYNRGELVEAGPTIKRTSPCFYPFQDLTVDWRGNILPCCNVYPDKPEHEKWIVGSLSDGRSVFEHYASSELVNWRKNLISFMPQGSPCETCSRLEYVDMANAENIDFLKSISADLFE